VIIPLIPIPFGRIQLYRKPISMRFGEQKLTHSAAEGSGANRRPVSSPRQRAVWARNSATTLRLFWKSAPLLGRTAATGGRHDFKGSCVTHACNAPQVTGRMLHYLRTRKWTHAIEKWPTNENKELRAHE